MSLYRKVRVRPWTDALVYVVWFCLLITLVLMAQIAPGAYSQFGKFKQMVKDRIPDGAEISVKDGKFNTSLAPASEYGDKNFAVVVDATWTGTEFPKAFEGRTGAFIGQDAFFMQETEGGSREVAPWDKEANFSVTKERVSGWIDKFGVAVVTAAVFVLFIALFAFTFVGNAIYAAVSALIILLVSRLWKLGLDYRQWLAVSLHAITLPSIIDLAFRTLGWDARVPFVGTVIFFMIIFAVLSDEKAKPVGKEGV